MLALNDLQGYSSIHFLCTNKVMILGFSYFYLQQKNAGRIMNDKKNHKKKKKIFIEKISIDVRTANLPVFKRNQMTCYSVLECSRVLLDQAIGDADGL